MEWQEGALFLSPTLSRGPLLVENTRAVSRRNCFDPERERWAVQEDTRI